MDNSRNQKGFTIVELLIVIVVIAILATITVVGYRGMTRRATVSKTSAAVNQYVRLLMSYSVVNGRYPSGVTDYKPPAVPGGFDGYICLGEPTSYPAGNGYMAGMCGLDVEDNTWQYSTSSSVNSQLKQVGSLPDATIPPTRNGTLLLRGIIYAPSAFHGYKEAALEWWTPGHGEDNCRIGEWYGSYVSSQNEGTWCVYNLPKLS